MGLGQADTDALKQSQSSSSSSSSSGSKFPKWDERVPALSITCNEDGEWDWHTAPAGPTVDYVKWDENETYERHRVPPQIEKFWMDRKQFNRLVHKVQERFGVDLWEILKKDPEAAAEYITQSAKLKADQEFNRTRDCAVCGETHDVIYGSFEEIDRRIVCKRHNIVEIKSAGLIE